MTNKSLLDALEFETVQGQLLSQRHVESIGVKERPDGTYSLQAYDSSSDLLHELKDAPIFEHRDMAQAALDAHNAQVKSFIVEDNAPRASVEEMHRREAQKIRHAEENQTRAQQPSSPFTDGDNF